MHLITKTKNSNVFVYNAKKKNARVIKCVDKRLKRAAENEIRMIRYLKHSPHVIDLDFVYEDEQNINLVLEHCSQGSLYDGYGTLLPEDRLRTVITSFLLCIVECHKHMIIHGDVKLSNFVVDKNDNVKLIDFGCASIVNTPDESSECNQGTYFFAAPENMRSIKYLQSDMWSLGVCAYVLAVGRHPYYGVDIWKQIWKGKMDTKNQYWRRLSYDCQDFMIKLLQTEACDRMSSYDALQHPFIRQ